MRVIAPTHPGWDGTPRMDSVASIADLATHYLARLREQGEHGVIVVGSSIGGWVALEMALQAAADDRSAGAVGAVVDMNGTGAVVEGEPGADFLALDARGLAEAAWHDPERGYRDPASLTDEQCAAQQSNGQAMAALAGPTLSDATLLGRPGGDRSTDTGRVRRQRPDRHACIRSRGRGGDPGRVLRRGPRCRAPSPPRSACRDVGCYRPLPRSALRPAEPGASPVARSCRRAA